MNKKDYKLVAKLISDCDSDCDCELSINQTYVIIDIFAEGFRKDNYSFDKDAFIEECYQLCNSNIE